MNLRGSAFRVSLGLFWAVMAAVVAAACGKKQTVKIGLMTAGLPWHFGPYQAQMHHLSLLLKDADDDDDDVDYDIYWLNYADPFVPQGVYKTYQELRRHIGTSTPPPPNFPLDHLTFLGQTMAQPITTAEFNKLVKEYDLDCLVTLMDVTKVIPTEPFAVPVVAWIPLHSETVSPATPDYWVLRSYHGIAGLAPSGAKAIHTAVGTELAMADELVQTNPRASRALQNHFGTVAVDFVPHIFDRAAIVDSAHAGLDLLKDHSVAKADERLTRSPMIHRGQEKSLEAGHAKSLFGRDSDRKDDFMVLLQGGNYDEQDRKGWDTSLQAFVKFYNSLEDPSGVHLLIHSMESYLIAADTHNNADAPSYVLPQGVSLHYVLHEHGLPREAYTIDIAKHAPEVVAAYKKRADVCLHPSKVEGFGMNVMECQVVGTPVVTTDYTAMGDFTKLGRAVPPRQTIRSPQFIYDMALPDVVGVADALGELYQEHLAMKAGDAATLAKRAQEIQGFEEWLDTTCSPAVVRDKFQALLKRAQGEFQKRETAKKALFSNSPPTAGAYRIAKGYHTPIVAWDAPWTLLAPEGLHITNPSTLHQQAWLLLLGQRDRENPLSSVVIVPAHYDDGMEVPMQDAQGDLHEDQPILVRTVVLTSLQARASRRKSLARLAMASTPVPPQALGAGLAIVERGTPWGHNIDAWDEL